MPELLWPCLKLSNLLSPFAHSLFWVLTHFLKTLVTAPWVHMTSVCGSHKITCFTRRDHLGIFHELPLPSKHCASPFMCAQWMLVEWMSEEWNWVGTHTVPFRVVLEDIIFSDNVLMLIVVKPSKWRIALKKKKRKDYKSVNGGQDPLELIYQIGDENSISIFSF